MSDAKTLLEKAQAAEKRRLIRNEAVTDQQLDLLLAWLDYRINSTQFAVAMDWKVDGGVSNVNGRIAVMLRHATTRNQMYWRKKV